MAELTRFTVPVVLALRRLRARPLAGLIVAAATAAAVGLLGWSAVTTANVQDENVRLRLSEARPDERSVQIVRHAAAAVDTLAPDARVDAFLARAREIQTAHLDRVTGRIVIRLLQEAAHEGGTTVLAASHDPDLVSAADGRLLL